MFFNPGATCKNSTAPNSSCGINNQWILFHESLHEYYDYTDPNIQTLFGITVNQNCTANITDHIAYTVFNQNQNSCGP
jgi:hypothetical protein